MKPTLDRFWNWSVDETTGERVLRMDGVIANDSWWGDEVTPAEFMKELHAGQGDITLWINSPGGDCIAASRIYTMLMDYKGNITVKIDGAAFSAASVVAMAGTRVLMSPTALIMIHNPATIAIGDSEEMLKASAMLDEVKETIINAYELKTGMNRTKLSDLMDAESFFPVKKAMELGFVDGMLVDEKMVREPGAENYVFSRKAVTNSLMTKIKASVPEKPGNTTEFDRRMDFYNTGRKNGWLSCSDIQMLEGNQAKPPEQEPTPPGVCAASLEKRLSLIPHFKS